MSQLTDGSGDNGKNIDVMEMIADDDDEISEAHLMQIDEQLAGEKSGGYTYNCKDSDNHSKKRPPKISRKVNSDNEETTPIRKDSSVVDVDDSQTESS